MTEIIVDELPKLDNGFIDGDEFRKSLEQASAAQEEPEEEQKEEKEEEQEEELEEEEQEQEEDSEQEEEEEDLKGKSIPYWRFKRATRDLKEKNAELQSVKDELLIMRTQYQNMLAAVNSATNLKPTSEPVDTFDPIDPDTTNKLQSEINSVKSAFDAKLEAIEFQSALASQEVTYIKQKPDLPEALQHVYKIKENELKALYPNASQDQVAQAAGTAMALMAKEAHRAGRNIPDMFYNLAKNYGYNNGKKTESAKPNIQKIAENKSKTRSIANIDSKGALKTEKDITELKNPKTGFVDPNKFRAMLESGGGDMV